MDRWDRVRRIAPLSVGVLSVVAGGLVLLGWSFDLLLLKSLRPEWVAMKPNAAVAFVLAGVALLPFSLPFSRPFVFLTRLCALLCGLIGLLALGGYIFPWDFGFDQWLFAEQAGAVATSHPGRMAPDAAACFVLLAAGLVVATGKNREVVRCWLTAIIGGLVVAVAVAAMGCYLRDAGPFLGLWGMTLMAFHTAILLMLLGAVTLLVGWSARVPFWSLTGRTALGFAVWTLMVIGSLFWGMHQQAYNALDEAAAAASANINKDISFRKWATFHGGVYVVPTARTPPNPYLRVPHRDVVTTTGVHLTLMNPAYMLREMQHYFSNNYGIRSGLTSLKPLNPANAPDGWERHALARFEQGATELMEVQYLGDQPYVRLMLPFVVETGCLKCHAQQGYKVGDIRGGVSTAVSLVPFLTRTQEGYVTQALSHGVIWLLGFVGLLLFYRREVALDEANQQAAEALRESEERFRVASATTNDLVYEWDLHDRLQWWGKIDEMLGYDAFEFPRTLQGWAEAVHPEDRSRVMAAVQAHLDGKSAYAAEYRICRKDGAYRWWSARGDILKKADGTSERWIGTVTDITERKEAEEALRKSEEQLLQAQKMESVGRLAGGVAHDFNNMLGVIIGYTELALEEVDPAQPLHANLQEVRKAAHRSADLTRQLLAFARKQTIVPKVLDLNETVEGMLKMLRRLIGEDIDLAWLPGKEMWPVKMDPSQLDQILANLCVNARDAIAGVGKVTIETHTVTLDAAYCADHAGYTPGQYAVLVVSDNGCGMDKEVLGKLFEPFFTTKALGKGTGLGLATVYGIARQNNGFVNVYSEPGYGSTFKVYLPRHTAEGEQLPAEGQKAPVGGGHETILLVEDEPAILNMTRLMLEGLGYQVLAFATPGEAMRAAREYVGEIHLLMTDVVMPGMNGHELVKNISAVLPGVRCLFMSGYTGDVIARQGVLGQGIHFVQKPFSREELAGKVREALGA